MADDEFDQVRALRDPLEQARRATDLLSTYQQRSTELARLRKDAIDRAVRERGLSFTAVANAIGLTKGRITQIRQTAPPRERAFFGVGPVTVMIPERLSPTRPFPFLSSEDAETSQQLGDMLAALAFQVRADRVPAQGEWAVPGGDVVAVCGPISSPTMARAYEADPHLAWQRDDAGRFWISDRTTGERWGSGMDDAEPSAVDVAYLGRLPRPDDEGTMIAIGGVHAIGSLGAATWLRDHLPVIHEQTEGRPFSMVVRSSHDGLTITRTEAACPPRTY